MDSITDPAEYFMVCVKTHVNCKYMDTVKQMLKSKMDKNISYTTTFINNVYELTWNNIKFIDVSEMLPTWSYFHYLYWLCTDLIRSLYDDKQKNKIIERELINPAFQCILRDLVQNKSYTISECDKHVIHSMAMSDWLIYEKFN
jgi:hypothetical protein